MTHPGVTGRKPDAPDELVPDSTVRHEFGDISAVGLARWELTGSSPSRRPSSSAIENTVGDLKSRPSRPAWPRRPNPARRRPPRPRVRIANRQRREAS